MWRTDAESAWGVQMLSPELCDSTPCSLEGSLVCATVQQVTRERKRAKQFKSARTSDKAPELVVLAFGPNPTTSGDFEQHHDTQTAHLTTSQWD